MKLFINHRLDEKCKDELNELLGGDVEFTDHMDSVLVEAMAEFDYAIGIEYDEPDITILTFYSSKDEKMVPKITRIISKYLPDESKVNWCDISKEEVVYFELNNWARGRDYPDAEPFINWMSNDLALMFQNEEFIKENKLCVVRQIVDMSIDFCITATISWVEEHCPELLTKYSQFLRRPDSDLKNEGAVYGEFGAEFLPYCEENIGLHEAEPW